MKTRGYGLILLSLIMIALGGATARFVDTRGDAEVREVRVPAGQGLTLAAVLYRPASARPERPAPGVVLFHGFINTREMQTPFAVELARRGFVVLSVDMTGHGGSGGGVGDADFGGPAALRYLKSLSFVNPRAIGLEGHSMGGAPVVRAALSDPDGYRAIALVGSTTGFLGGPGEGTRTFPKNLLVVFGRFDEFSPLMWQTPRGADVPTSARLRAIFGVRDPVVPGRLYGDLARGDGRKLELPAVDHPGEHASTAAVAAVATWFEETLSPPEGAASRVRPPGQAARGQIWPLHEAGTFLALCGGLALALSVFLVAVDILTGGPLPEAARGVGRRDGAWFAALLIAAAPPALLYFPLMKAAPLVFFGPFALFHAAPVGLALFPAQIADQIVVFVLGSCLAGGVLSLLLRGEPAVSSPRGGRTSLVLAAVGAVGVSYLALLVERWLFGADYRLWVLAFHTLEGPRLLLYGLYLPFFLLYFGMAVRLYAQRLRVKGEGLAAAAATGAAAFGGGFVLLVGLEFATLAVSGRLLTPAEPLNVIIAIQFAPLMSVIGAFAAVIVRRTGSAAPAAVFCAVLVTWYVLGGTAIFKPTLQPLGAAAAKARR